MKKLAFFIAFFLILTSCRKKEPPVVTTQDASKFLYGYTRGMVYPDQSIKFLFLGDSTINTAVLDDAISFQPKTSFTSTYDADKNEVIVNADLEIGESYDVYIDLQKVLNLDFPATVKSQIKVHQQYVSAVREGLIIKPDGSRFIKIGLETAIPVDRSQLKEIFDVNPKKISIQSKNSNPNRYYVLIRHEDGDSSEIKWDGSSLKSKENGVIRFWGSDLEGFNIVSSFLDRSESKYYVYFSKLLDEKQDADGLVTSGDHNIQYDIENNQITIFLESKTHEVQTLKIHKGIKSKEGETLNQDYTYDINLGLISPEVKWMDEGTYIPSSGAFSIPFRAIGLHEVHVTVAEIPSDRAAQFVAWNDITNQDTYEIKRYGNFVYDKNIKLGDRNSQNLEVWNEYGLDLSHEFERKKGYIYRVMLDFTPSQTILECVDKTLLSFESNVMDEEWFDNRGYRDYYYNDYYDYRDVSNPCKPSYYLNYEGISKNVHCTNVFPIIKKGGEEVVVAVKELLKENPANAATISLLSLQGEVIRTEKAGSNGIVKFNKVKRKPHAVKIEYFREISYFSLQDGKENEIQEFDIVSDVRDIDNRIYVYSERDVRRPGDTVFLNVMLNKGNFTYAPDLPITINLINPKGVLMETQVQHVTDQDCIYSFAFPTSLDALTGYWRADVKVGQHRKRHSVRIETIKPNVVDVVYKFDGEGDSWIYNDHIKGSLQADFLAGYALRGGTVQASANIYPILSPFKDYAEFQFGPYGLESQKDVALFKKKTSQSGLASYSYDKDFKDQKAVVRLVMDTKVDLPGGGVNTETESFTVSPFDSYVGIKKMNGKGWRGSYRYGENPVLPIVHLDQKGNPIKGTSHAKATLYKRKKDWWYDRYRLSRDSRLHQSQYYDFIKTHSLTFKDGLTEYLHSGNSLTSGMYKLVVEDEESGHMTEYYFHTITSLDYAVNQNPIYFQIDMEKYSYAAGENMQVKLPQMTDAQALVSIEKGDRILEAFWMDLDNPNLELNIKDEWFPNFYLNVNIVQNYDHPNNDRPLRMYTIQKVLVNERNKVLEPIIASAEKIRPNEDFTITVSEKNNYPMDYTLAVVDNGLLNLTGFDTPDPIQHFNKLYSLMVKTWDIYEELIHYMNPAFAGVFSIGGDGVLKKLDESADFNRFEPVVYHLGPFHLEGGEKQSHTLSLPNYIGSLRVMVVAANDETFGSSEKDIRAASPLMLQTQLPRALNVTDKVHLPVTIFKDEKSISKVDITSASGSGIKFIDGSSTLNLGKEDQGLSNLTFEVEEQAGKTSIQVDASSGQFKTYEKTDIYVNYPNGYSEQSTYTEVSSMEEEVVPITSFGYDKTKNVDLAISGIILPAFSKYYNSLIRYPYGCLEQTASRGMALLYIDDLIELSAGQKIKNRDYLDAAITKIGSFQNKAGRLNYWQNDYYHGWGDLYAGHFLLEANDKNLLIEKSTFRNWLNYTYGRANQWSLSGTADDYTIEKEELIQAYRLYILAKAGKASKSAMNRFRNRSGLKPMAKMLLGSAYHYVSMDDIGKQLFYEGFTEYRPTNRYYYYSLGGDIRNRAFMLYMLLEFEQGERVDRFYKQWVMDINKKRHISTQEMGFALMACNKYFADDDSKSNQELDYALISKTHNQREKLNNGAIAEYHWGADQMGENATIQNKAQGKLYVIKTERAISKDIYTDASQNGINMSVIYKDLNGNPLDPSQLEQGKEMNIIVLVKNVDLTDQRSMALSVRMPSGWELINPRLYETAGAPKQHYTYQDYRDDKVYTFFDVEKGASKAYSFRVKANIKGDFYMPPITCENMYRGEVSAKTKAGRVSVL